MRKGAYSKATEEETAEDVIFFDLETDDIQDLVYEATAEWDLDYGDLCDCLESNTGFVINFTLDTPASTPHDALTAAVYGLLNEDADCIQEITLGLAKDYIQEQLDAAS
jgi:hypothetical protein